MIWILSFFYTDCGLFSLLPTAPLFLMSLLQVWLLKPLWLHFPRRNSPAQCQLWATCPASHCHDYSRWQHTFGHTEELVTECYKPVGWAVIWPWILTQNLGQMEVNCLHPFCGSSLDPSVPTKLVVCAPLKKTKLNAVKRPGNVLLLQGKKNNLHPNFKLCVLGWRMLSHNNSGKLSPLKASSTDHRYVLSHSLIHL